AVNFSASVAAMPGLSLIQAASQCLISIRNTPRGPMGTRSRSSDWCKGEEDEARPAKTIQGAESPRASSAALHLVSAATSLAFAGSLKRIVFTAITGFGPQLRFVVY